VQAATADAAQEAEQAADQAHGDSESWVQVVVVHSHAHITVQYETSGSDGLQLTKENLLGPHTY
jgi:hypothetical protein